MTKKHWKKPELTNHGDVNNLIKGTPLNGGNKEIGPSDGATWDGNPVSGPA